MAVAQLFQNLPPAVAQGLAPQIDAIMGQTRIDLLTFGGFLALFFATSAVETLRAALNGAYRVHETRSYPVCLGLSMLLVLISGASMLVLTWAVVVGPAFAAQFEPSWVEPSLIRSLLDSTWLAPTVRYTIGAAVIVGLENIISGYMERWVLVLGVIYVLVTLFAPTGLVGLARRRLGHGAA